MKITCNIIRDILPLYYENMASEDSSELVEEHINHCESCRNYLEEMNTTSSELSIDTNISPLLKIKSTLFKKKIQTIILSIAVSLVIGVLAIAFLTAPEYIPYSEKSVEINELTNGSVVATFSDEVSGYDIERYPTEGNRGVEYHITTWDSIWNRTISKSNVHNTILNPNRENVLSVYYYEADGSEDILIYGRNMYGNGGVITLPRLVLSYYSQIAILLAVVCGSVMFLFHRNKKIVNVTLKILLLPISYLLAQLMITGFSTVTYSAQRDFFAILLVMIPLYIAILTVISLISRRKNRSPRV